METRMSPVNQVPAEKIVTEMALLLQQAIVGYRFHPTEEELINYLKSKATGCRETLSIIPTLENIYESNPWDLPAKFNEKSIIRSRDQEWWFICPQTQNQRIGRKTPCGSSWKITGKHKDIKAENDGKKIGFKITLVFLDGQNSKGTRSNWVLHEFHLHPDDMGFVLCFLKMKQDEKADNQEPSIQALRNQPNHAAMAMNGDFSSTPQFQCPKVSFSELIKDGTKSVALIPEDNHHSSPNLEHLAWTKNSSSIGNSSGRGLAVSPTSDELNFPCHFLNVDVCSAIEAQTEKMYQKADLVHSLEEKVDETSGTSKFIGEQADKSCDGMDCDNPEQLPFAEHHVQEMQDQLNELIMNGSSCSAENSSSSGMTITNERSRNEPWTSPLYHDSFPDGEHFNLCDLLRETEADTGVIQYGQLGQSSWDNHWANKNQRPVYDTLEGAIALEEEEGFVEQKLNHPHDTEKIITECASSDGAPAKAKAQASEFKEKETTMIQPQQKYHVKIESNNISNWENRNNSLSPTRSTASTSCRCQNKSTIDPIELALLFALVLLVYVIVEGI
ncbi:protein NTM1-like 9 isoform X2 [Eucalyptus grandis]|uniref:protein NTM1-like 9 isoform X2 n=1 Tax=Eucalyptus grandis TaxID=71139 RepID=UPI00192E849B|nr:protein NTM1-like 9 isoform X2 [Eucalyptus grandis]